MSVEVQAISKCIISKKLDIIHKNKIEINFFQQNAEEMSFIVEHYNKYGNVPDRMTFMKRFPDFPLMDTNESNDFLAEQIRDSKLKLDFQQIAEDFKRNQANGMVDAVEILIQSATEIKSKVNAGKATGTDIITYAGDRYRDYLERMSSDGMIGVTTGIKELDDITLGWANDDFILLLARTNMGKSWIAEAFALSAWLVGARVGYYSGEMSALHMGYRFDTLNANISNTQMLRGSEHILEEYKEYTEELSKREGLIVYTQQDFGNRKPKFYEIDQLIQEQKFDIFFIDQLSLMDDRKGSDNKTARYTNISQDVVNRKSKIPIFMVAQSNRGTEQTKEKMPQIHNVEYADAVGQDATRIIGMYYEDGLLHLGVQKNRFGSKNDKVTMKWDIDKGIIEPLLKDEELEVMSDEYGF